MNVIGLDIGNHSIKYAVLAEGERTPVLYEIPTYILINPTKPAEVIHAGKEALDKYLDKGIGIPADAELRTDLIKPAYHRRNPAAFIKPLLEKIDEATRKRAKVVAVTFSDEAIKDNESVDAVLNVISECFDPDTQLVALDEARCIAANYGFQNKINNLIICDFGKSALKISACSFKNGAYQLIDSSTNTELGWSELENQFLNHFEAYKNSTFDTQRQGFRRDLLELWFDSKTTQRKYLYSSMFWKPFEELDKDGGLHDKPFLSMNYGSSSQDLTLLEAHKFYKDFSTRIIEAMGNFLSKLDNEFNIAPVLITGAGACPPNFVNFLRAIRQSENLPNSFVVVENPKFFVAESASKIANNELQYYPSSSLKISFEYKQLKHGNSVSSQIEIPPNNRVFGVTEALQIFNIKSGSSAPNLSYGDFVFTIDKEIEEGEYTLYQSLDRHGDLMLHLQKNDQENGLRFNYERR